jgi:hypothetical protein
MDSELCAICTNDVHKVVSTGAELNSVVAPLVGLDSGCLAATRDEDCYSAGIPDELLAEKAR